MLLDESIVDIIIVLGDKTITMLLHGVKQLVIDFPAAPRIESESCGWRLSRQRLNYQPIGSPSRNKPPFGPSGGNVAAQTIPFAPSGIGRAPMASVPS